METILKHKKTIVCASKAINLLAISIISFLMASTSNALLFNPFILSTVWFSQRLSPLYGYYYLINLTLFAFIINLNYGLEVLFVSALIVLIELVVKRINSTKIYKQYLSLFLVGVLLSIRYLSVSITISNLFNCLINISLSLLLAFSLDNVKNYLINKKDKVEDIYKLLTLSFLYVLALPLNTINVFLISLITLILIKYAKKEVVMASLFVVFIYNYLFFNISVELLLIYLIGLFFACFNKKLSPLVYLLIVSLFYVIKYEEFYRDFSFYLNFVAVSIYYLWPKSLDKKIKDLFIDEETKSSVLESQVYTLNSQVNNVVDYLNLIKKCPVSERSIEEELIDNLKSNLCNECQNNSSCAIKGNIENYIIYSLRKEDKSEIINNCFYPYKLIKRLEMANKSYIFQTNQKQDKIQNRILFNRQVDTILNPLTNQNNEEVIDKEIRYQIDYDVINEGFSKENGDSYQFISLKEKVLLLLSDGMGHCKTSKQLSSYLIELFTSLYKIDHKEDHVINNVNLILKTKTTDEVYATLDLGIFDLSEGLFKLYKAGSFSTFLIRNHSLIQFSKIFPPLGILDNVDIFSETMEIMDNDVFVFLTDGFGDDVRELLESKIESLNFDDLENLNKELYQTLDVNDVKDDKTLVVIKIKSI